MDPDPDDVTWECDDGLMPSQHANQITSFLKKYRFKEHYSLQNGNEPTFDKMWPTVILMCSSLITEPKVWDHSEYYLVHIPTNIRYWTGSGKTPITEAYLGTDTGSEHVFSRKQGELIREALATRDLHTFTVTQLTVATALGTLSNSAAPEPGFWGRFWASIRFFPTMALFCIKYKRP